ncbi:MAG: hypothetical protein ABIK62_04095, partial [candidate division WOR-3 bacterium]
AVEQCRQALQLDVEFGYKVEEAVCRRILARALAGLGNRTQARLEFEQSLSCLVGRQRNYELACSLFDYARFLTTEQESEAAIQRLAEAATIFRRLGITVCDGIRITVPPRQH